MSTANGPTAMGDFTLAEPWNLQEVFWKLMDQPVPLPEVSPSSSVWPAAICRDEYYVLESVEVEPAPPPWHIAFSPSFIKETKTLDAKLMGRVLRVLEELSEMRFPFMAKGDTLKPLTGELSGKWRYRIGDHRFLFEPIKDDAVILALALGARGSVYD